MFMRFGTCVVSCLDGFNDALKWLLASPLFPLQILLFLLVGLGKLGAGLGFEQLFWHENIIFQLGVGFFVGSLFAVNLFLMYLADVPTKLVKHLGRAPSLLPSRDGEVKNLGRFLTVFLVALFSLLVAIKLYQAITYEPPIEGSGFTVYMRDRWYLVPFIFGYVGSVVFAHLIFRFDEARDWRTRLVKAIGGAASYEVPEGPSASDADAELPKPNRIVLRKYLAKRLFSNVREAGPLHGIAALLFVVAAAILAFMLALSVALDECLPGDSFTTPISLLAILLIVGNLAYGYFAFQWKREYATLGAFALFLMCWNSSCIWHGAAYKIRFPGLTYDKVTTVWVPGDTLPDDTAEWSPASPGTPPDAGLSADRYENVILRKTENYAKDNLILGSEPLKAMCRRWQAEHGNDPNQKPKLVFIATSGGGARAAVWTAVVLEELETDSKLSTHGFRNHIRLITGASGGMVAAGLYAADFGVQPPAPKGAYADVVGADSLNRTAQSLLLRDLCRNTLVPPWSSATWDRGRTLEWRWGHHAQKHLGRNPFGSTFKELRDAEKDGRRPSLVFSPMMIDDSRRLLVSNLSLEEIAVVREANLQPRMRSGLEFHRLFPDRSDIPGWDGATSVHFTMGTAARMSATFPVISPAVSLPTSPPRQVVDAGFYDNYGVDLAAFWMWTYRKELKEFTSGVALLEIRAFPLRDAGRRAAETDPDTGGPVAKARHKDLFSEAAEAVSAPLGALLNARGNVAYYRNAEMIELLRETFADQPEGFFYNGWFEMKHPAALNWHLTSSENMYIREKAYSDPSVVDELKNLQTWYGTGGGKAP